MRRVLSTLLPMASDGVGPSFTCTRLLQGTERAGQPTALYVNRFRMEAEGVPVHAMLPGMLARLPYRFLHRPASALLERWYLASLSDSDIAYLWPSASLAAHREAQRRGVPILLEGINTRMAAAKQVLDVAYDAFGAPPGHGITQVRIDEEEEKLSLASAIFAPSPAVEAALKDADLQVLPASYGVDPSPVPPIRTASSEGPVDFVFCGYACVRKGIHHLLDIWPQMPKGARLRLVGRIEPVIVERYGDLLNSDQVLSVGFSRDVPGEFAQSDVFVFPSLEEGDPLVSYEAARAGLPLVASPPGAGRIGADTGCVQLVESPEALLERCLALYEDPDLRRDWGQRAQAAVAEYSWDKAAARRVEILREISL